MGRFAKKFQKESHSMCGILWIMTAGLGFMCLFPTGHTWMNAMSVVIFVLSLLWSIWASSTPKD